MRTVTVAPVTGTIRGLSTEVPVGLANGLDKPSVVSCDNIVTIPADNLGPTRRLPTRGAGTEPHDGYPKRIRPRRALTANLLQSMFAYRLAAQLIEIADDSTRDPLIDWPPHFTAEFLLARSRAPSKCEAGRRALAHRNTAVEGK